MDRKTIKGALDIYETQLWNNVYDYLDRTGLFDKYTELIFETIEKDSKQGSLISIIEHKDFNEFKILVTILHSLNWKVYVNHKTQFIFFSPLNINIESIIYGL